MTASCDRGQGDLLVGDGIKESRQQPLISAIRACFCSSLLARTKSVMGFTSCQFHALFNKYTIIIIDFQALDKACGVC